MLISSLSMLIILGMMLGVFVKFVNDNYDKMGKLIFLYNGHDTLGMTTEGNYKEWLMEYGMKEEILSGAIFYDKGYAFFRYCMDNAIAKDDIVDFVKFLIKRGINDSREMTKELWREYIRGQSHAFMREELVALLEHSDDMIHIPDLMEFLRGYNNIVVTGGGINECLKEVEIALKALDREYVVYDEFVY